MLALGIRPNEIVSTLAKDAKGHMVSQLGTLKEYHQRQFAPPADMDVWFGVNPLCEGIPDSRRGSESEVTRVVALWADLDIKDTGLHSMRECERVVKRLTGILGIRPAVVIHSGHGLQPIWRVADTERYTNGKPIGETGEANTIRDAEDREEWRVLLRRWGGLVQDVVGSVRPGARIDNVYDLSRVLRCPGSVNNKGESVRVVTVIDREETRSVGRRKFTKLLDRRDAKPLGGHVRPVADRVPTSFGDAEEWIQSQPGARATVEQMKEVGPHRSMVNFLDYEGLVRHFAEGTDDERSAHALMNKRVYRLVNLSVEGYSGLVLALLFVKRAYLEVMDKRRCGEFDGDPRSENVALEDFHRAVRGAVERARGRARPVEPQRDTNGKVVLRVVQGGAE
jgi:hypothetical protein